MPVSRFALGNQLCGEGKEVRKGGCFRKVEFMKQNAPNICINGCFVCVVCKDEYCASNIGSDAGKRFKLMKSFRNNTLVSSHDLMCCLPEEFGSSVVS